MEVDSTMATEGEGEANKVWYPHSLSVGAGCWVHVQACYDFITQNQ